MEILEDEIFFAHPRFQIECSNLGRIRNHVNQYGKTVISLGCRIRRAGYKPTFEYATKVRPIGGGKKQQKRVHQLVLECFDCECYDDKTMVDHIDRDSENNSIWNLSWVNHTENNRNRSK